MQTVNYPLTDVTRERLHRLPRLPAGKRPQAHHAAGSYWIKEGDKEKFVPLPSDADFILYDILHRNALQQRRSATAGQIPYDMNILYNFWSHFLIRGFNSRMYDEFARLAHEDLSRGVSSFGIEKLKDFYDKAFTSDFTMPDRVVTDYISVVKAEHRGGDHSAFQRLRSAWRNGATNMKNRKKISDLMDAELKAELDS